MVEVSCQVVPQKHLDSKSVSLFRMFTANKNTSKTNTSSYPRVGSSLGFQSCLVPKQPCSPGLIRGEAGVTGDMSCSEHSFGDQSSGSDLAVKAAWETVQAPKSFLQGRKTCLAFSR